MILPTSNNALVARQYGYPYGYGYGYRRTSWSSWGRWVLLACLIGSVLLIFFLFSCISARRRRRLGYNPYRGTGWALGRTPQGHAPATYTGNQNYKMEQPQQTTYSNTESAPPQYQGENYGYYGSGQQNGVELQTPSNTYQPTGQAGYSTYAPPAGPPPTMTYTAPAGPPPGR